MSSFSGLHEQHDEALAFGVATRNQTERHATEKPPIGAREALQVHRRPDLLQRPAPAEDVRGLHRAHRPRARRARRPGGSEMTASATVRTPATAAGASERDERGQGNRRARASQLAGVPPAGYRGSSSVGDIQRL